MLLSCAAFDEADTSPSSPESTALPEWVQELPEDLDVCIAQRHFEEAYDLLQKAQQLWQTAPKEPMLAEIK